MGIPGGGGGGGAAANTASYLSLFQKTVLAWDFFQLLRDEDQKKQGRNATVAASPKLPRVKVAYTDVSDYMAVYEPLLFEEVKAQIVKPTDDAAAKTDSHKGIVLSCSDDTHGFHMVTIGFTIEIAGEVSENDLLLISDEKMPDGDATKLPAVYAFGLVEYRDGRDKLKLRTYVGGEVSPRLSKMLSLLKAGNSFFWVRNISSLSTIMREYSALRSVVSLPFMNLILSATDSTAGEDRSWDVPRPLLEYLESNHNESQLNAIRAALARKRFVLIQGPPGTGKTQTILGLLSAILHAAPTRVQTKGTVSAIERRLELPIDEKYQHWTKASPWLMGANPRDLIMPVDGDDGFFPTSGNELKPELVTSNRKYRAHVLVCAPSNSALDEIVLRLMNTGIRDENGQVYHPKIVRIGVKSHHSIQAVSMDYLVEQRLASVDHSMAGSGKAASAAFDRDRIRTSILDEAAIVFSTLSFSGSTAFSQMNHVFDVVIVDEAAQAVEPATLVPLAHGCKQVFLVGDPVQLPATVISSTAQKMGYDTSLFKRFQMAGYPVQMLKTQYRMHPRIRSFPSKEFYSDSLDDGPDLEHSTKRPWHKYRCFGPFCFFDIDGVESQTSVGGSWENSDEVDFVLLLYHHLTTRFVELKSASCLAVITPYGNQVKLLRDHFRKAFGVQAELVDINTIDGFQGREKDVAIFSCVRSNRGKGIGFVSDFRRMNVGITRARSSVLVVGSASTLEQDDHWSNLVKAAKDQDCFFKVSKPYASFFSDANLKTMLAVREEQKVLQSLQQIDSHLQSVVSNEVNAGEGDQDMNVDDGNLDADDMGFDED